MKVLLIGGAGFVGYHLSKYYLDKGASVFITKLPETATEFPPELVYDMDLLDMDAVLDVLNKVKPDYICNLAALSSVAQCWNNPQLAIDINIKGCVNLFEAVRTTGLKARLLIIGSGEEYGDTSGLISESNPLKPVNIYGVTKAACESFAKVYSNAYGLDIVLTRSFNQCGPYQPSGFVIADFCKQVVAIENGAMEPVINVGNLAVSRDFLDVRDVVKAYDLLLAKGVAGEVYNLASGSSISLDDMLNRVLSRSSKEIKISIDKNKFRPVDSKVVSVDISKITEHTTWKPSISLDRTLDDTLNYWRSMVNL